MRICKAVPTLARDLCSTAPAVDVVQEVRGLGAYLRHSPKGATYRQGNAYLLRNIQRKQREAAERGQTAPPGQSEPPPASERKPPPAPPPNAAVQRQIERARQAREAGDTTPITNLFARIGRGASSGGETP